MSFFIEKYATREDREIKRDQAIEANTVEKLSNSERKRKKTGGYHDQLKKWSLWLKSPQDNKKYGNLFNLKKLNGLAENQSDNLENCIQCDEKDCSVSQEETCLKITPKKMI